MFPTSYGHISHMTPQKGIGHSSYGHLQPCNLQTSSPFHCAIFSLSVIVQLLEIISFVSHSFAGLRYQQSQSVFIYFHSHSLLPLFYVWILLFLSQFSLILSDHSLTSSQSYHFLIAFFLCSVLLQFYYLLLWVYCDLSFIISILCLSPFLHIFPI
jgi:hypothetical protein